MTYAWRLSRSGLVVTLFTIWASACQINRADSLSSALQLVAHIDPDTLQVGDAAALSLTVRDAKGMGLAGMRLLIKSLDPCLSIIQPAPTDNAGRTVASLRCGQPGQPLLRVLLDEGITQRDLGAAGTLICTPAAAQAGETSGQAAKISVISARGSASTDASEPAVLTLMVLDDSGHPVVGQTVTIVATRPGDAVTPSTAVTDAQGQVVIHLTGGTVGTAEVRIQAGSIVGTGSVNFVSGAADLAQGVPYSA